MQIILDYIKLYFEQTGHEYVIGFDTIEIKLPNFYINVTFIGFNLYVEIWILQILVLQNQFLNMRKKLFE